MTTYEDAAMSDAQDLHRRQHEYTFRLPTPPRIVVPPPTLPSGVPELHVAGERSPGEDAEDLRFLKSQNLESIVQKNTMLDWSYERRRQAQLILPWLYLGPMTAARDSAFLKREGITAVVAIQSKPNSMAGALQAARESCEEVWTIEAATYHGLIRRFSDAARTITRHAAGHARRQEQVERPQIGKTLVFCESGNEKSAAVAAAYLMETLDNFDHVRSMQVCQAQRFCVNFDDTIKNILRAYWDILQAKRAVSSVTPGLLPPAAFVGRPQSTSVETHSSQPATAKSKRSIQDTRDEDDVEMGDGEESDMLRFEGRDITPFVG